MIGVVVDIEPGCLFAVEGAAPLPLPAGARKPPPPPDHRRQRGARAKLVEKLRRQGHQAGSLALTNTPALPMSSAPPCSARRPAMTLPMPLKLAAPPSPIASATALSTAQSPICWA